MEIISGKRKRNENENENEEADIEKFSELVEKFRAPYNWFRAKISSNSAVTAANNGDDRKKKIIVEVEDDSKKPGGGDDGVWMPCFLLQDFEEEEVIKSWKARAMHSSETAAPAADFETIDGVAEEMKKGDNNEELNLRLSL